MRRYLKKIIPIAIVIAVFGVSFFIDTPNDIKKLTNNVVARPYEATACTPGSTTTRYTSSDSSVYDNNGNYQYEIPSCTTVTTYCSISLKAGSDWWKKDYFKISKTNEWYISSSNLKTSEPSNCWGGVSNTVPPSVKFDAEITDNHFITGENRYFANMNGTLSFRVKNIENVYYTDGSDIVISVISLDSGKINEGLYRIENYPANNISNNRLDFNLVFEPGAFTYGNYQIVINHKTDKTISKTLDFFIDKNYTSGKIIGANSTVAENYPTVSNNFTLNFEHTGLTNINNLQLKFEHNGKDETFKFDIDSVDFINNVVKFHNIESYDADQQVSAGDYIITASYTGTNQDYKTSINFTGQGKITFKENALDFTSKNISQYQYVVSKETQAYNIEIISITGTSKSDGDFITFVENGNEDDKSTITLGEFKKIYSDFNIDSLNFDSTTNSEHKIVYKYTEAISIYGVGTDALNIPSVLYYDALGKKATYNLETFKTDHPTAWETLNSSQYKMVGEELRALGTGIKIIEKTSEKESTFIYSISGGKYVYNFDFKDISERSLSNATINVYYKGQDVTNQFNISPLDIKMDGRYSGTFSLTVSYLPDGVHLYEDTVENFDVQIKVTNRSKFMLNFSLANGMVDYYLASQVDDHLDSEDPLTGANPPSNKNYEYYIGFYLIKDGTLINKRSISNADNQRIYNRRVKYFDENEKPIFYDIITYTVHITKYFNGIVYYDLLNDKGEYEPYSMTETEFEKQYKNAYDLIEFYEFDSTDGHIIGDKFDLHITKYGMDDTTKTVSITYYTDDNPTERVMTLTDLKNNYPKMYGYVITRFVTKDDTSVILGGVTGSYEIYEYDGKPIEGQEVTDLFEIKINNDVNETEKVFTILPKTEVDPGSYYFYASYNGMEGEGWINDSTLNEKLEDGLVLTEDDFPEMYQMNPHMTIITYASPDYSTTIDEPELSNLGREDLAKMFANVSSTAKFGINLNYIYDLNGISYYIEKYNTESKTWELVNDYFTAKTNILAGKKYDENTNYYIELTTIDNKIKAGKYRLNVAYENNGFTATTQNCEFEVFEKYYLLTLNDVEEVEFIHNYRSKQNYLITGDYIAQPENLNIIFEKYEKDFNNYASYQTIITSTSTDENGYTSKNGKAVDDSGTTLFEFTITYSLNEGKTLYDINIWNVKNVTPEGTYRFNFNYVEDGNDEVEVSTDKLIGADKYSITAEYNKAIANENDTQMIFDLTSEYIDYSDLSRINYIIYQYTENGDKIDVSSSFSENRIFTLNSSFDNVADGISYHGSLIANINYELVDWDAHYVLYLNFWNNKFADEFEVPNLRTTFDWEASSVRPHGTYYEDVTDDLGHIVTQEIEVDGFYNNVANTMIDVDVDTIHTNDLKWDINKSCLGDSCAPGLGTNWNSYFEETNTTGKDGKLNLKLKEGKTLPTGDFALVLYYSGSDYKIYEFTVKDQYVFIEFGKPLVYSNVNETKVVDGLYVNKSGTIYIPTIVRGIAYDKVDIKVTDANGADYSNRITYSAIDFADTHNLTLYYNPLANITPQVYTITASYTTSDGVVFDDYAVEMNTEYFNFDFSEPTYTPDPIYPNVIGGGTIDFVIDTEDIPNVTSSAYGDTATNKHKFATNAYILDEGGNNVTESFKIYASNLSTTTSPTAFGLHVSYECDDIVPGIYTLTTFYGVGERKVTKSTEFEIGDYVKTFKIKEVSIYSTTNDGKVHRNIGGSYYLDIVSDFQLFNKAMNIEITNKTTKENVTSEFVINYVGDRITIDLVANEPYLAAGYYTVKLTYQDTSKYEPYVQTTDVYVGGIFKNIITSNMESSVSYVYADKDDQYYTFDVDKNTLTTDELDMLKTRIYDQDNNLVYSDIETDNVVNKFEVINNLNEADGNMRINILAFKANVGTYNVKLYLEDEVGEYSFSNDLLFSIDSRYYKISLSQKSYVKQTVTYNNDTESIFDRDAFTGYMQFSSTYGYSDNSVYSIRVFKGLKEIAVAKNVNLGLINEDGVNYLSSLFDFDAISEGDYTVAACINGLAYATKEVTIKKFIKIDSVKLSFGGVQASTVGQVYVQTPLAITYTYTPANATNPNLTFSVNDNTFATIDGNTITALKEGDSVLNISGTDFTSTLSITSKARVSSTKYEVTYGSDAIIYINSMNSSQISFSDLFRNLNGVAPDYRVLSSVGADITTSANYVGTGMTLVSGGTKYTFVVIGDLNGDAKINNSDVAYLYQYVRGKQNFNGKPYANKAAYVRKMSTINVGDVAKLYQFIRGTSNSL